MNLIGFLTMFTMVLANKDEFSCLILFYYSYFLSIFSIILCSECSSVLIIQWYLWFFLQFVLQIQENFCMFFSICIIVCSLVVGWIKVLKINKNNFSLYITILSDVNKKKSCKFCANQWGIFSNNKALDQSFSSNSYLPVLFHKLQIQLCSHLTEQRFV